METWMLPLPLSSPPPAVTSQESGWANGSLSVWVVGVVVVKLPLDPPDEKPFEHPIDQLPSTVWLGLAVMVTVMMSVG